MDSLGQAQVWIFYLDILIFDLWSLAKARLVLKHLVTIFAQEMTALEEKEKEMKAKEVGMSWDTIFVKFNVKNVNQYYDKYLDKYQL